MRVFITGGAGFIGSHLADHYVNAGHQVTLLDNFSTGSQENIAHLHGTVTTVGGDIRNVELIDQLTKDADLAKMVERLGPPPRVIWLRCGNTSNAALPTPR